MAPEKDTLLDELITFLENEKDMYGPFSVSSETRQQQSESVSERQSNSPPETFSEPEASQQSGSNIVAEEKQNISSEPAADNDTFAPQADEQLTLEQKLGACTTLEELKSLCEEADQLKTDLDGTNLVFGVGNPSADLMIIGEAPGYNEDQQGEPFVGAAGQLLNKILKAINFDREDIYIANILKHRPPDNRNPLAEERERSLPFLEKQIDLISPKVILCVGKVSGTTLLDKDEALKRLRGEFYDYRGAKLTVTYHPAALLRNPKWKRPVWEDVQRVRKLYDELGGTP